MDVAKYNFFDELHHVLERQIILHNTLIELLEQEYLAMSSLDVKALSEITSSKETVLDEILNLENLRIKSFDKNGFAKISFDNLLLKFNSDIQKKFKPIKEVLVLSVERAKDLNQRNLSFAESSLNRIDDMKKNVFGLNNNAPLENYSQQGMRTPIPEQGGRLLSTEA